MKTVRKGDVVLVTMQYGVKNVISAGVAQEDVSGWDMRDESAVIILDGGGNWAVGPADLFLVRSPSFGGLEVGNKKLHDRVAKRGYWWEIRSDIRQPKRAKR